MLYTDGQELCLHIRAKQDVPAIRPCSPQGEGGGRAPFKGEGVSSPPPPPHRGGGAEFLEVPKALKKTFGLN